MLFLKRTAMFLLPLREKLFLSSHGPVSKACGGIRKVIPMITRKRPDQKQDNGKQSSSAQRLLIPALPPGSIYSDEEVRVLGPWQKMRQRFLSPIVFVLSRLGIRADILSYTSVLLGLGFCLLASF